MYRPSSWMVLIINLPSLHPLDVVTNTLGVYWGIYGISTPKSIWHHLWFHYTQWFSCSTVLYLPSLNSLPKQLQKPVMQVFRQLPEFRQIEYNSSYFRQLRMASQAAKSVYFGQFDVWSLASLKSIQPWSSLQSCWTHIKIVSSVFCW